MKSAILVNYIPNNDIVKGLIELSALCTLQYTSETTDMYKKNYCIKSTYLKYEFYLFFTTLINFI